MSKIKIPIALWRRHVAGSPRDGAASVLRLTVAARRLAEAALEELGRLGVTVTLDEEGRAHFRTTYTPSRAAKRLAIETHGDLLEASIRFIASARQG